MLEFLEELTEVDFRIGIHTGPLVACVVGTSKFQYDIWGDTFNTASRLESSSEPGRIQISSTTHALLEDGYVYEARGDVEVKGKSPMITWLLVDERGGGLNSSTRSPRI